MQYEHCTVLSEIIPSEHTSMSAKSYGGYKDNLRKSSRKRTEHCEGGWDDEQRDHRRVQWDLRRLLDEDGASIQVALHTSAPERRMLDHRLLRRFIECSTSAREWKVSVRSYGLLTRDKGMCFSSRQRQVWLAPKLWLPDNANWNLLLMAESKSKITLRIHF